MDYQARHSRTGQIALAVYRFGHWIHTKKPKPRPVRAILRWVYNVLDFIFVRVIGSSELPATAQIGQGIRFPHFNGIIINRKAIVGDNVTIFHHVTLGIKDTAGKSHKVGNNVFIGAGAKLLGPITVGDGAVIGANAVVLTDVPPGARAVGVPARILPPKTERRAEEEVA